MEGGVVVIKFEADTAKVEESLKKIEKTATKVSSATSKATKRANDEEVKAARRKYRNEMQFAKEAREAERNKNKEIASFVRNKMTLEREAQKEELAREKALQFEQKTRYAIQKAAAKEAIKKEKEAAKEAAAAEKKKLKEITDYVNKKYAEEKKSREKAAKQAAEFAKRAQRVEADEAKKTANIMKQLNREKMQIAENERKQDLARVKENARLKAQIEKDVAKQVKKQNAENAKSLRESNKSIEQYAATIYSAKFAIKMIADGMKDTWNATKGAANTALTWYKNLLKVTAPMQTLVGKLITSSRILERIKRLLSFDNIFNFGRSSLEAASDLTEVQNIVDTAFPNMTKEMEDWAENSINAFGMNEKSVKQYAATLGLMAQSAGLAEKASYKLGTGLTAVTADLASIYNKKQEDVYEALRSGVIGGRTAAIQQLGINMSVANLQAYAMSKGITASYTALNNATKTAIRYNYVIEQTRKMQGDFIRTSGTWANQSRVLSQNIEAIKISIGKLLVTALLPLLKILNQILGVIKQIAEHTIKVLSTLGIKIQQAAAASNSSGYDNLTDSLTDVGDAADDAASKVAKLTDGPFSEMHKLSTDISSSNLSDFFGGSSLLEPDTYDTSGFLDVISVKIEELKRKFNIGELEAQWNRFLGNIVKWINDIKIAWKTVWDKKGDEYVGSLVTLLTDILDLVNDISDAFNSMWNAGYGQTILDKMLTVATDLNKTLDNIVKKFKDFWNSGSGHFGNVLTEQGQLNSRKLTPAELAAGKRHTNGQHTPDAFRTVTDITGNRVKKADTELRELTWGEYLAAEFLKVQVAIFDTIDAVIKFVDTINSYLNWDTIGAAGVTILDAVADSLNKISDWLEQHPEVAEKIAKIIENIATGFANAVEDVLTFITDHLDVFEDFVDLMLKLSEHTEEILLFGAALKILGPIVGGLGRNLLGLSVLSKLGIFGGGGGAGAGFLGKIFGKGGLFAKGGKLAAGIGKDVTGALTTAVETGDFLGGGVLIGGLVELGSIATKTVGAFAEKIKEEGLLHLLDYDNAIEFFFLELPDKVRGPMATGFAKIFLALGSSGQAIEKKIAGWFIDRGEDISGFFEKAKNTVGEWKDKLANKAGEIFDSIKEKVSGFKDSIVGKAGEIYDGVTSKLKGIKDIFNDIKNLSWSDLANNAKNLITGTSSIGKANPHSGTSHYDFSGKHANGGVWAPNSPAFAVLGDQSAISGNEYALTEQHLDNIANRMTSAIMSGFARANLAGAGGGNQPINIYIGDEQIKDFIVKSVDENNYRRF